uniref:Uncharacterized protein n=1 Tax=Clastoptera arizonana TaxID=38151 RepID=A0A1B6E988_9HEMI
MSEDIQKKKGRRSSFFNRRRSSLFVSEINNFNDIENEENNRDLTATSSNLIKEPEINEYNQALKIENNEWKSVLNEFKTRAKNDKHVIKTIFLDKETYSQYLTEDNIKFIEDVPDYQKIGELMDETIDTMVLASTNLKHYKHLVNELLDISEEQLRNLKIQCIEKIDQTTYSTDKYEIGNVSLEPVLDSS